MNTPIGFTIVSFLFWMFFLYSFLKIQPHICYISIHYLYVLFFDYHSWDNFSFVPFFLIPFHFRARIRKSAHFEIFHLYLAECILDMAEYE